MKKLINRTRFSWTNQWICVQSSVAITVTMHTKHKSIWKRNRKKLWSRFGIFQAYCQYTWRKTFVFNSVIYTEQLREFFLSFTAYLQQHKAEKFYGITSSHSYHSLMLQLLISFLWCLVISSLRYLSHYLPYFKTGVIQCLSNTCLVWTTELLLSAPAVWLRDKVTVWLTAARLQRSTSQSLSIWQPLTARLTLLTACFFHFASMDPPQNQIGYFQDHVSIKC